MPGQRGKNPTRGKMGRIPQLPPALKSKLDRLLRAGVPQSKILHQLAPLLEQIGEKPLSAATLNRYATKMERVGVKMRQAREVAEVWTTKFGNSDSKLSQHIIEVLRTLIFELTLKVAEPKDADGADAPPLSADAIARLSLAVQRLERAAKEGAQRERALRQKLTEVVDAEAKRQGLSPDTAGAIRAALLGGDAAHAPA